jgi:hypothetical protein
MENDGLKDKNFSMGPHNRQKAIMREGYDPDSKEELEAYLYIVHSRGNEYKESQLICERTYWDNLANVALRRFPELQPGEHIGAREIKRRLAKIRKAGYSVNPYSRMNAKEAWGYLQQIRTEIGSHVRHRFPEISDSVDRMNIEAMQESRKLR